MEQIKFNVLNFGEIKQCDEKSENKIVQHLFSNEKWLKGAPGDGKLDIGELEFFSKNFLNENNEVDYNKYVQWQKANMDVGSTVHKSFSFQDIEDFFKLFQQENAQKALKVIDVDFNQETFKEISKDDPVVQENKVLQHLFMNEKYLNDKKEFDGKLDANEIQRFLDKFVIDGKMTEASFEAWKQLQLSVGNKNLEAVTYEDMKEFLNIIQDKPKSQPQVEGEHRRRHRSKPPSLPLTKDCKPVTINLGNSKFFTIDEHFLKEILGDYLYNNWNLGRFGLESDKQE